MSGIEIYEPRPNKQGAKVMVGVEDRDNPDFQYVKLADFQSLTKQRDELMQTIVSLADALGKVEEESNGKCIKCGRKEETAHQAITTNKPIIDQCRESIEIRNNNTGEKNEKET